MTKNNLIKEATTFIKSELGKFIELFPQTRVRYEYDSKALVHCIEIVPNETYHLDKDYIIWENEITNKFIDTFNFQNICFVSDDAIVGLTSIDFQLIGTRFVNNFAVNFTQNNLTNQRIQISCSNNAPAMANISWSKSLINTNITAIRTNSNSLNNVFSANSIIDDIIKNETLPSNNFSLAA